MIDLKDKDDKWLERPQPIEKPIESFKDLFLVIEEYFWNILIFSAVIIGFIVFFGSIGVAIVCYPLSCIAFLLLLIVLGGSKG